MAFIGIGDNRVSQTLWLNASPRRRAFRMNGDRFDGAQYHIPSIKSFLLLGGGMLALDELDCLEFPQTRQFAPF
ncbi:hypothetical protein [Oscillatoria sp. FACHB-1406]|uniref:hypothetical protein n=1 Tax=Oscillatoria sp. FACHB-1406 TaxID=2692846 RepID=UPI001689BF0E|nr:hypothetical protein [Oscillatoria sp. FACHB-1406]MBD2577389.1 hypothetical protein [Oscillatoria sp. FACHB-1406]